MPQMSQVERECAIDMLTPGMSTRAVARQLNVHISTISRRQRHLMMVPEGMAAVLSGLNQPCKNIFFAFFITCFVHNIAATVSYDRKELLDIRTAITHLRLDRVFLK
jgi:hypothetical protein